VNAPLSIGIIEKSMLPIGEDGNGMPDFGEPPGEEDITQLWKDDVIWYKLLLRGK